MDMRAETELRTDDAAEFDFVVLGGILGEHPPKDRAADLRESFMKTRGLGLTQMTTDTALLVCREVLEEQKPLKDLKFVDSPAIPTDSGVTRWLDEYHPLNSLETPLRDEMSRLRQDALDILAPEFLGKWEE